MSGFRIDVADLLAHSGARREVALQAELDEIGASTSRIDEPVDLALRLDRIPDGIVARGTVRATVVSTCSACLGEISTDLAIGIDELFEATPLEGETYPIDGRELDLEQLVRDALLLELPLAPRCDGDCVASGVAVSDRASDLASDRSAVPADPRWAALAELDLDLDLEAS